MASQKHIVVIGAGVTGLTTGMLLAEQGYDVTIIAAHVPGDLSIEYTSPWAGAHWRTHATTDEPMLCDWDVQTFDYWADLLDKEQQDRERPRSGLKMYDSCDFWDSPVVENIWWAPHVRDFRTLSEFQEPLLSIQKRAPPSTPRIADAVFYRAIAINVPHYLRFLLDRFRTLGGVVIKDRLRVNAGLNGALEDVESKMLAHGRPRPDVLVNATGLGAQQLCGDEALYPIRGQTILVKGEANAMFSRLGEDYVAYAIIRPGSGTTILGGTKEVGVWEETPDPATTNLILERATPFVPELLTGSDGGFEIISVQCGLRPGRRGGPRVEKEVVGGRKVVHAYGHAGAGYQNSIGSARLVRRLVEEFLATEPAMARL